MEFLSLQTLVFAVVVILFFFAFRPSWRDALRGVRYQYRLDLRKATMTVIVRRDSETVWTSPRTLIMATSAPCSPSLTVEPSLRRDFATAYAFGMSWLSYR
jgi:hypothetical protein